MSKVKSSTTATMRLKQDFLRLQRDPVPYIVTAPLPTNILEWHYVLMGPEDTPFEGGIYHGRLIFPADYPFKPPSIYIITPNGRFQVNTRLCLSISDFHPETWNPSWSVSTILTGLVSFLTEKTPTYGSCETTDYQKRLLASQSLQFNVNNRIMRELFPDIIEEIKEQLAERESAAAKQREAGHMGGAGAARPSHGDEANGGSDGGAGWWLPWQPQQLVLMAVVAVFAYSVQFVLRNVPM